MNEAYKENNAAYHNIRECHKAFNPRILLSKESIVSTLDDYAKAYCEKNIQAIMSIFEDSDNISVIGTGEDETCVGREEIQALFARNFQEATARQFIWNWVDVRISNNHAVASVKLTIY